MNVKYEWLDRLRAVDREAIVIGAAVARLRIALADGTLTLPSGTSARDLASASGQPEATYLIRLWAEFETAIRSYHRSLTRDRVDPLRTSDLIEAVGGSRRGRQIAGPIRIAVHEVRRYRNALVHARDNPPRSIGLGEAKQRLGRFLGHLPDEWP